MLQLSRSLNGKCLHRRPFRSCSAANAGWERLKDAKDREAMWEFLEDLNDPAETGEGEGADPFAEPIKRSHTQELSRHEVFNRPGRSTSSGSGGSTPEKERHIFSRILDSILTQPDQKRSRSVTSSVQALFEQNHSGQDKGLNGDHDYLRPFSPAGSRANVKLDITTDDVRKLPLSYGSLIRQSTRDSTARSAGSKLADQARKYIEPILKHIAELPTDQQVVEYYSTKILGRFDQHMSTAADHDYKQAPCTDTENPPLTADLLPLYLEKCMIVLSEEFREPNEAITLFESSKNAGIEFYAHSCSVESYNQMLKIRWTHFWDLHAVESLVSEMYINAVQGNQDTVTILGDIAREYLDAKQQIGGLNGMPLWDHTERLRVAKINQFRIKVASSLAKLDTFPMPFAV